MMNKTRYIQIACLAVIILGGVLVSSQLQPAKADIYSIAGVNLIADSGGGSCSKMSFSGGSDGPGGYAAVRLWSSSTGNTNIDSYLPGYPTYYLPIFLIAQGFGYWYETSPTMPLPYQIGDGKSVHFRVYRALSAAPYSWDGETYQDAYLTCIAPTPTPHP